jgi:hypothetical protein
MKALLTSHLKKVLLAGVIGVIAPMALVAQPVVVAPRVTILLKDRHGHATPERSGFALTGGGNTDVQQPKDDTVVITMTGVAVAGPHPTKCGAAAMTFDFNQCFAVEFADVKLKKAKITLDAVVIGLLRGDSRGGCASVDYGVAVVSAGGASVNQIAIEPHSVCGCENLSINDHVGPSGTPVTAGDYNYHQTFRVSATHGKGLCGKASSAEFAPDPALDPLWISYWEPFHGAAKKDFGFRVTVNVSPDE